MRRFDLNIETVLENWDVADALREIIANAIDEQALTGTAEPDIFRDSQGWHIRDHGRGLEYQHLTQNEDKEKLANPGLVIGKFGVGLKDALATLDRRRIGLEIHSTHGDITLGKFPKEGFADVLTLHAVISDPSIPSLVGTDFVLEGVTPEQIEKAKSFFLRFSGDELLESTEYGQVLRRGALGARIYVNGVRVAEEERFLFSYNIISMTKAMRKALNRERIHVGRTAYVDRVKDILLACQEPTVADGLVQDLQQFQAGQSHDEVSWLDVAVHSCKLLNAASKVIFLTPAELLTAPQMVDRATGDGYRVVTIPETVKQKIGGLLDISGQPVVDLRQYAHQWNQSFQFQFVDPAELSAREKRVFDQTKQIFRLAGGRPANVKKVLISTTMRLEGYEEATGLWEPAEQRIVIKRSQLRSAQAYAATLLHETVHARTGAVDITRAFEQGLTEMLGIVAGNAKT